MDLNRVGLVRAEGVFYPAVIVGISKASDPLQPLFEAFTNSLEAIAQKGAPDNGTIVVKVYFKSTLLKESTIFDRLTICDTGIGFNDGEFRRFLTFKDNRKGYNNQGSGRIQLLHSFHRSEYSSVYQTRSGFKKRQFHLSKNPNYLKENAIAYLDTGEQDVQANNSETTLTLRGLISEKDANSFEVPIEIYKEILIGRYIQYFCAHRDTLPMISIERYVDEDLQDFVSIESRDIPDVDSHADFQLFYKKQNGDGKFVTTELSENFTIKAFRIPKQKLAKNSIKLTSKDEIVEEKEFALNLKVLSAEDHIDNNRFLFLVSSPYINIHDDDVRGRLKIPKRDNVKRQTNLFQTDVIFFDDIEHAANEQVVAMYQEIAAKSLEKLGRIDDLKKMFLLNDEFIKEISISINDSEERILEKVYAVESKIAAKGDAEIKKHFDELVSLNPVARDYQAKVEDIVNKIVKEIPHQNRAALTHYVARRKLVLDIYDQILKRKLEIQQGGRNHDEKLLHNLLFRQGASNADTSDLWILNEDFVLYRGTSESKLLDIEIDGTKIFKDNLTAEENDFCKSLGENRLAKRPDVLLFPDEGKCVIIEFKTPGTNVSDHLNEITYYASLILNLTKPEFKIDTFYGYLVGESMEPTDIKFNDSDFQDSAHFKYAFRPSKRILGHFKTYHGSLYTEVIKYSTLHLRALNRNKMLLGKLFSNVTSDN